jgi:hypothetical protein
MSWSTLAKIAADRAAKEKSDRAAAAVLAALAAAKRAAPTGRRYIPPGRLEIKALAINGGRGWV